MKTKLLFILFISISINAFSQDYLTKHRKDIKPDTVYNEFYIIKEERADVILKFKNDVCIQEKIIPRNRLEISYFKDLYNSEYKNISPTIWINRQKFCKYKTGVFFWILNN